MEMCVTAFGLFSSQPAYQRIINTTLQDINNADSFVDDVCQFDRSFDEMVSTPHQGLQKCREFSLQMRTEKCKFGYYEIDFVGYQISKEGLSLIQSRILAILCNSSRLFYWYG